MKWTSEQILITLGDQFLQLNQFYEKTTGGKVSWIFDEILSVFFFVLKWPLVESYDQWFWPFSTEFDVFLKNLTTYERYTKLADTNFWLWNWPKAFDFYIFFENSLIEWKVHTYRKKWNRCTTHNLNTWKSHFQHLKHVIFLKGKIDSPKVQ